jgi:hypothetical protein
MTLSSEPLGWYTCALCKGEFNSSVSEQQAAEEYARNFPDEVDEPHEMVCNVCYDRYFAWANK